MNNEKTYYVLIVFCEESNEWHMEFGDFDKSVVEEELDDYYQGSHGVLRKNLEILTVGSASQEIIDQAVADFNRSKKDGYVLTEADQLLQIKLLESEHDERCNIIIGINVSMKKNGREQDHVFSGPFYCPFHLLEKAHKGGTPLKYMEKLLFKEYKRKREITFKMNNSWANYPK